MYIGMQIIYFKKLCVPVSTETSKVDKLLKMPSHSISEGAIFQNFLERHASNPLVLACFASLCASHNMSIKIPASPTSTMMAGPAMPPPFQKSRSASEYITYWNLSIRKALNHNTDRLIYPIVGQFF